MNSHVGFQIGKFGTRVATLIAIVIFLSSGWIWSTLAILENSEKVGKVKVARFNDDNDDDDDDDRNIYLRNEYL